MYDDIEKAYNYTVAIFKGNEKHYLENIHEKRIRKKYECDKYALLLPDLKDIDYNRGFINDISLLTHISNNKTNYYEYDGRANVAALTSGSGDIIATYDYDAFGNTCANVIDKSYNVYGKNKTAVGMSTLTSNPYTYKGEYTDNVTTNLQYLRSRYYDVDTGTFTTKDTYEGDIYEPLSINAYTFAQNNPANYTDPSGHGLWSKIKSVAKKVVNTVKKAVKTVVNGVKKVVKTVVNGAIKLANTVVNGAKKVINTVTKVVNYATNTFCSKYNK